MTEISLRTGGFTDAGGAGMWGTRFGAFGGTSDTIVVTDGVVAPSFPDKRHAEAQLLGVVAADFTYAATIRVGPGAAADLQFRISDRGRLGVRLEPQLLTLYQMRRADRRCGPNSQIVAHCPDWRDDHDEPVWSALANTPLAAQAPVPYRIVVRANGRTVHVYIAGVAAFEVVLDHDDLAVGRVGVYAWGAAAALSSVRFSSLEITTKPALPSNFALLYSTAGYELTGTKRRWFGH